MSISRLLSGLVAAVFVVTMVLAFREATGASMSSGQDPAGCVQGQLGVASSANTAAPDWIERYTASLNADNAVSVLGCVQPGSAIPADRAATDWVERYAASLKAVNPVDLSDCVQQHPDSAISTDPTAPDWVERRAASLKAANVAALSD